jgi:ABC-type sugar transport system permease subunit
MYESAFLGLDFGKASAVGVLMLVVVLAVAIPTQVIRQIRSTRGASHA